MFCLPEQCYRSVKAHVTQGRTAGNYLINVSTHGSILFMIFSIPPLLWIVGMENQVSPAVPYLHVHPGNAFTFGSEHIIDSIVIGCKRVGYKYSQLGSYFSIVGFAGNVGASHFYSRYAIGSEFSYLARCRAGYCHQRSAEKNG